MKMLEDHKPPPREFRPVRNDGEEDGAMMVAITRGDSSFFSGQRRAAVTYNCVA